MIDAQGLEDLVVLCQITTYLFRFSQVHSSD